MKSIQRKAANWIDRKQGKSAEPAQFLVSACTDQVAHRLMWWGRGLKHGPYLNVLDCIRGNSGCGAPFRLTSVFWGLTAHQSLKHCEQDSGHSCFIVGATLWWKGGVLPYGGKEGFYQGQISGELLELVNEVASSVFHDCVSVFNLGYWQVLKVLRHSGSWRKWTSYLLWADLEKHRQLLIK